ncbi:MAG: helix-turn-helix transcriptional regulator [Myxococcales bacterium]|nr:helix-turn-helix transcriptional regulator [Myxococcales bacterium]
MAEGAKGGGEVASLDLMRSPSRDLFVNASFRFGRFDCDPEHALWRVDNRSGPWPLIAFPGTPVEIMQADFPAVIATTGCMVLYNPYRPYRRRLIDRRGDHCVFLGIAPALLRELLVEHDPAAADRSAPFVRASGSLGPRARLDQALLLRALERSASVDAVAVEEALLELCVGALVGERPRQRPATVRGRHREVARALARHLATSFHERQDLQDISSAVGVSTFHAARVFRAVTGETIHGYRHALRLFAVLERLGEPRVELTELALEHGFASHSHLTTAFRQAFGAPPSYWRARLQRSSLAALADARRLVPRARARF